MIALMIGLASLGLSIYVLVACNFYEVSWTDPTTGKTTTHVLGLFNCKFVPRSYDDDKDNKTTTEVAFTGPMNGLDMIPTITGFFAAVLGFFAVVFLYTSHWKLPLCFKSFRVRNIGLSSCLLMMAAMCQALTMLVLVSEACTTAYEGQCKLLTNAYISAGAAGGWFLASCFNREIVGRGSSVGGELPT
jgi:hypothetical protein